jgi:diguanylate cyclase (GGDEF)-like protein/PAS domain S-box-containing protein
VSSPWQMLAGNMAIVALFVLGWAHARFWMREVPGPARAALLGLAMGLGAIATMLMSAEVGRGLFLDLRLSLVAVSAFFGGPLAGLVTLALAVPCRVALGGSGMQLGLVTMVAVALSALALRLLLRGKPLFPRDGILLGFITAGISGLGFLALRVDGILGVAVPLAVLNLLTTSLASLVFLQARRISAERDLLAAALAHAPDYAYVKDHLSRFVAVNLATARLHGFASMRDNIGKTDADIYPGERAEKLLADERLLMETGKPQIALEELVTDQTGADRWLSTSKIPLRSSSGETLGLACVTRDITEERQLRHDLIESRNALSHALAEMSDGLAMFDRQGRILLCNEQYAACFPYTSELRKPGMMLRDILNRVVETGEQLNVPADDPQGWIERILANLSIESEAEVHMFDDRWLQVRTRPTNEGTTLVVVSDVTRIKQAELALHSATDQLKLLVRTDALTGLLNRRAFDDAMETEIARSIRAASPMSLLMIDVDRFKAYNDQYGHPAGDECLKLVAEHLRQALKRPADMAARYGGEEFAAILPDTDEDGAYLVAEAFRRALVQARHPHRASERGVLTASVGVATYLPDNLHRSAAEIIRTADEALYSAKAAGRDRVFGTRVSPIQRRYANE